MKKTSGHFNISLIKKILLIALTIIILSLICIFLYRASTGEGKRIDFIEIFNSAAKQNFDENKDVDKYLPGNKHAIAISYLKYVTIKLFSGPTVLLSKNGVNAPPSKSNFATGCFRTVFTKMPVQPVKFNYFFKKKSPKDYWLASISWGRKNLVEIREVTGSKQTIIERMEIPSEDISSNKINILFTTDFLFLFTNDTVLFQCKHPGLSGNGKVDFEYQGSKLNSEFSVKFGTLTDDLMKKLGSWFEKRNASVPFHKYRYSDPQWNRLGNDDRLTEEGSGKSYLRRLKLNDTTMPCIYFFPRSFIKYNVKIPKKSILSFYLAFYRPGGSHSVRGNFYLQISDEDGKYLKKFEINQREVVKHNPEFERFEIDLHKYSGKKCEITFGFQSDDTDKQREEYFFPSQPIAALGSPVIYPPREGKEKNVILISLDTLRSDHLGIYGYSRKTSPRIDSFASDSIMFQNVTAQSNWTLTSHMSIFSSLYPYETGYQKGSTVHQATGLANEIKLMPEYLRDEGYKTGAITGGAFISEYFGFDRGLDFYHTVEKSFRPKSVKHDVLRKKSVSAGQWKDVSSAVDKAIEWIKESRNSKFFLFLHTYEIHKPYNHDLFLKELDIKSANLREKTIAEYDSGILYTDREIGRLIAWLKMNKLYDETIIIIISDHGENFDILDQEKIPGFHGETLYDCETQVPLIIGGAIATNKGIKIDNQASLVDILPTILDYLDIPVPDNIRGISLRMLIEKKEKGERLSYSEAIYTADEKKALRSLKYKIIKNFINERNKLKTGFEFYKLAEDPGEKENIIGANLKIKNIFISRLEKIIAGVNERRKILSAKPGKKVGSHKDLENQLKALGYVGN
jgi:arylsulfatase A-like enzyme